ncbi:hypothetical protein P261_01029 [Lachnospiraceae bacterium TWA4]|nr:hypothetical protein P261_01029 [Lachnospiraceae bacterium TWA4]
MVSEKLEKHICDTIKEWQMKIGYQEEPMKLYYPEESLRGLLDIPEDTDLYEALAWFINEVQARLGVIKCSNNGDRYCLEIPPVGCKYIAEEIKDSAFLKDFLEIITSKKGSLEQIADCFRKYDENFVLEDRTADGLGHVYYFTNTDIDDYMYCVESDDFGITYHRFVREDYEKLLNEGGHHHHE